MFGRKKEQEPVQREYPLREMIQTLVELSEEQWGGYAFYHEPLERKFTEEQKKEYARLASACGREEAVFLRKKFPGESIRSMAEKSGLKVKLPDMPTGGGHVIFAQFTEPDEIVIYRDCIKKGGADKRRRSERVSGSVPPPGPSSGPRTVSRRGISEEGDDFHTDGTDRTLEKAFF